MDEKIPAGTMVKIGKQDGTVIFHGDGVVHVDIDGEQVSVHPSQLQIVSFSKEPSESKKKDPADETDDENTEANAAS